jgi:hypothetical protein
MSDPKSDKERDSESARALVEEADAALLAATLAAAAAEVPVNAPVDAAAAANAPAANAPAANAPAANAPAANAPAAPAAHPDWEDLWEDWWSKPITLRKVQDAERDIFDATEAKERANAHLRELYERMRELQEDIKEEMNDLAEADVRLERSTKELEDSRIAHAAFLEQEVEGKRIHEVVHVICGALERKDLQVLQAYHITHPGFMRLMNGPPRGELDENGLAHMARFAWTPDYLNVLMNIGVITREDLPHILSRIFMWFHVRRPENVNEQIDYLLTLISPQEIRDFRNQHGGTMLNSLIHTHQPLIRYVRRIAEMTGIVNSVNIRHEREYDEDDEPRDVERREHALEGIVNNVCIDLMHMAIAEQLDFDANYNDDGCSALMRLVQDLTYCKSRRDDERIDRIHAAIALIAPLVNHTRVDPNGDNIIDYLQRYGYMQHFEHLFVGVQPTGRRLRAQPRHEEKDNPHAVCRVLREHRYVVDVDVTLRALDGLPDEDKLFNMLESPVIDGVERYAIRGTAAICRFQDTAVMEWIVAAHRRWRRLHRP